MTKKSKKGAAERRKEDPVVDNSVPVLADRLVRCAYWSALNQVLIVLDAWIEGAKENHDALGHRGELFGEECWTKFHPEDVRRMVNDAARDIGLPEPWRAE